MAVVEIRYERWECVADTMTCHHCWSHNGQIFRYRTGPQPPLHTKCRCIRHYLYSDYEQIPDPPDGSPPAPVDPLPPILVIPIANFVIIPVEVIPSDDDCGDDDDGHGHDHHWEPIV